MTKLGAPRTKCLRERRPLRGTTRPRLYGRVGSTSDGTNRQVSTSSAWAPSRSIPTLSRAHLQKRTSLVDRLQPEPIDGHVFNCPRNADGPSTSLGRSGDGTLVDICIRHPTTYRYRQPVSLGPHRLMMRPRESRDLRLLSSAITLSPEATVTWAQDVAGNAVATATFHTLADSLVVESVSRVDLAAAAYPVFAIAPSAIAFPFRYTDDEWTGLGNLTVLQYPRGSPSLRDWAQGFVAGYPTDTLSLLKDINAGVGSAIAYQVREDEGTQSPSETLFLRMGSCRDLATLLVEAVRSLGFGARVVSGYLHDPSRTLLGSAVAGATHAWAEIFLPGAGWITFDPTTRSVGGANLIPVAVARDIRLAMPLVGSFTGPADALLDMSVQVSVAG